MEYTPADYKFEIYRPPRPSGRLEPTHKKPSENVWRPSISYKYSLEMIANQLTPAENYRNNLINLNKLRKTEKALLRNRKFYEEKVIKIQAWYRSLRIHIKMREIIKENVKKNKKKLLRNICFLLLNNGEFHFLIYKLRIYLISYSSSSFFPASTTNSTDTASVLYTPNYPFPSMMDPSSFPFPQLPTKFDIQNFLKYSSEYKLKDYDFELSIEDERDPYLIEILCEALFSVNMYDSCMETCEKVGDSPRCKYLYICCLVHLQRYDEALEIIPHLINFINSPERLYDTSFLDDCPSAETWPLEKINKEANLLQSLLLSLIEPRQVEEAFENYNYLLEEDKNNFDLLYQRACLSLSLGDYTSALNDIKRILVFNPYNIDVRMMRTRIYCCQREWVMARHEIRIILKLVPDHNEATTLLLLIKRTGDVLPPNSSA